MKKIDYFSRFIFFFLIAAFALTACSGGGGGKSDGGNPATSFSIDEVLVPGATSFPTRTGDSGTGKVNNPYYMAKYEVTYSIWKEVYDWSQSHGYTFTSNSGKPGGGYNYTSGNEEFYSTGHDSDPVTYVNWYDAVVWCNALTEYYNAMNGKTLGLVYKDAAVNVIKNSTDSTIKTYLDGLDVKNLNLSATGFRLPTSMEWELAARYRGTDSTNAILMNGLYWTKGDSASGATGAYTDATATQEVAWYFDNSPVSSNPDPDISSTHPAGQKPLNGNALGLYDMSGNVWEWCFDRFLSGTTVYRYQRGGAWDTNAEYLQLGDYLYGGPGNTVFDSGFRPVRTAP